MNKSELIKSVSKQSKLTQRECSLCLQALKQVLVETLSRGEAISLSGFGRFCTRFRPERQGVHPLTRDIVSYPAKYVPTFYPSALFKAKIH